MDLLRVIEWTKKLWGTAQAGNHKLFDTGILNLLNEHASRFSADCEKLRKENVRLVAALESIRDNHAPRHGEDAVNMMNDAQRGLSADFLKAMRNKLDSGRAKGYIGWDKHWKNCVFPSPPIGSTGFFVQRLLGEIAELIVAIEKDDLKLILSESADVANIAMFIADIHSDKAD